MMMSPSMMHMNGMEGGWMLPVFHLSGILFLVGIIALTIWMTKLDKKQLLKIAVISLVLAVVGVLLVFALSMTTSMQGYGSMMNKGGKQMMNDSENSEYGSIGTEMPAQGNQMSPAQQ